MQNIENEEISSWNERIRNFVFSSTFPCIGAQRLFRSFEYGIIVCNKKFKDDVVAPEFCENIYKVQKSLNYKEISQSLDLNFRSIIVLFPKQTFLSEEDAETSLWYLYRNVHKYDSTHYKWDVGFNNYIYSPSFGMSIGGIAHFTPLLHPNASSLVRQFEIPMLILNPHFVFKQLRNKGYFDEWRNVIRNKEKEVQSGWINPKLSDHGDSLEASQYALTNEMVFDIGRCPFTGKGKE